MSEQGQDYVAMAAGIEMDRLIGKKVMGCRVVRRREGTFDLITPGDWMAIDYVKREDAWSGVRHYSTEIAEAWKVVEHLAADGWTLQLQWKGAGREYANTAEVSFQRHPRRGDFQLGHAVGDTAPLAICRAALATLMYQDVQP